MSKMIATLQVLVLPTVTVLQLTAAETDGVFYTITISIMLMHIVMVGFACHMLATRVLSLVFVKEFNLSPIRGKPCFVTTDAPLRVHVPK